MLVGHVLELSLRRAVFLELVNFFVYYLREARFSGFFSCIEDCCSCRIPVRGYVGEERKNRVVAIFSMSQAQCLLAHRPSCFFLEVCV